MTELGVASWIPLPDRSLYSWVHRPQNGEAKGAVVIAPPLAREQVISYRTLRMLAIELARQGWVAIRFAWTGTGESAEMPEGADPAALWKEDLAAVTEFAGTLVGTDRVHALGLRAGAALLAATEAPLQSRLLWEPVGGKIFLRQQSMLRNVSLDLATVPSTVGTELGGTIYLPHQAKSLASVVDPAKLPADALPTGSRVVIEKDQVVARKIYAVASLFATVPPESLQRLIELLPGTAESRPVPEWTPVLQSEVKVPGFDQAVIEEILEVGTNKLPGVLSRPLQELPEGSETVLLVPASAEPKDGVTALWVLSARRLAAQGVPTIRTERRGSGDLGCPDAVRDPNPYTAEAVNDIEQSATWLHERFGGPVTGVGLCAGAWLVGMASEHSPIDRVLMLNNVAWRDHLGYYHRIYNELDVEEILAGERRLVEGTEVKTFKSRVKTLLRHFGPYQVWLALGRRGMINVPEVLMEISSRQAELIMHVGGDDHGLFAMERGEQGLKRLQKSGRKIELNVDPSMDHALLGYTSRVKAIEIIERTLLQHPAEPSAVR